MTRNNKKPITDESYNDMYYTTLVPNASTKRYPDVGTTFPTDTNTGKPIDYFIIRNKSAVTIRVVTDGDADVDVGNLIYAGEDFGLPVKANEYISIYGGDGTAIEIHMFWW